MPRLKLKVESALHKYLSDELTGEEFKESIQSILNEFEGKNLLHRNIGQLTWRMQKQLSGKEGKFRRIWVLLDQINPRIKEDSKLR
ncbi:MAG: hypothetical protein PVF96_03275 [Candidatus Bathyarchaeota archaeon]|jgi:hypothetical protein